MQVYLVGGAVRDELLGRPVCERDWVVVGATPEEMERLGYPAGGPRIPGVPASARPKRSTRWRAWSARPRPGYRGFVTEFSPEVNAGAGPVAPRPDHQCHGARCPTAR